jgi:hypothetical protein
MEPAGRDAGAIIARIEGRQCRPFFMTEENISEREKLGPSI